MRIMIVTNSPNGKVYLRHMIMVKGRSFENVVEQRDMVYIGNNSK
jgi:hypothetical protein